MAVVSDYTSLIAGQTWWGWRASGMPLFLTYSFELAPPDHYLDYGPDSPAEFFASFESFTADEILFTDTLLAQWADGSGIVFLPVDPGEGDIRFGKYDLTEFITGTSFTGYGFYPSVSVTGTSMTESDRGGDILISTNLNLATNTSGFTYLLLHEIGHALGLKHPFEGNPTLDPILDNKSNTVMSYTGPNTLALGSLDVDAVEFLYGMDSEDGAQVASWVWDDVTDTLTQTGYASADFIRGIATIDIIYGMGGNDFIFGGGGTDSLVGGAGDDTLLGGTGDDSAVFSGDRAAYTITPSGLATTISGADGTDFLKDVEHAVFDNVTVFLPGVSINFASDDPSSYMDLIRDFDGNDLGGVNGWVLIGSADIQNDGDDEYLLVNRDIGRWASVGPATDGLIYFYDYSWGGDTRVVGIYIDPLVESGEVEQGGPFDSQLRFQNDLFIENINLVLHADDYDSDSLQEIYFGLTDETAYLHAYMHADGNIQYANYQSEAQVIAYLTDNGYTSETWEPWLYDSASQSLAISSPSSKHQIFSAGQSSSFKNIFAATA